MDSHIYDVIGIGAGVFNLSLAVLLEEQNFDNVLFFDKNPQINWHQGLLLESSELQVNYLKDLVCPVDPTSRFTFLNYLSQRGLLYQFMNRKTGTISRNQFQHYFRWVADQLPALSFNTRVTAVIHDGEHFIVTANGKQYRSKHISVATGIMPNLPECAKKVMEDEAHRKNIFHVNQYANRKSELADKRVAVVGGGQSSAEVFSDLLNENSPSAMSWYGRRLNFHTLEDNCFINELYVPGFMDVFKQLPQEKKEFFVDKLAMSSDGINQQLLDSIYRLVFERHFFSDKDYNYDIRAGHELTDVTPLAQGYKLTYKNWMTEELVEQEADKIILATGFQSSSFNMLEHVLEGEYQSIDDFKMKDHFELIWRGMETSKIFVQNTSKRVVGLIDPNLSIAAWRAAMIANAVMDKKVYPDQPDTPVLRYM